jgi:hypothetical protein
MNKNKEKIHNLEKVHLTIETGRTPDSMDLTPNPLSFDFIFGLGTNGLTPFEFELAESQVGEALVLPVQIEKIPELFGHLAFLLPPLPEISEPFYIKIRLLGVSPVDQREVIKSMAENIGCGEHCCGEHDL